MSEQTPPPNNTTHVVQTYQPYAGRETLFARLQQYILDPTHRNAVVITGQRRMGKTATVREFTRIFSDPILPVLVMSDDVQPTFNTENLVHLLVARINAILDEHDFSLVRVPELADSLQSEASNDEEGETEPDEKPVLSTIAWFMDVYMPEVMAIIRPHRRIVWLFDDALFLNTGNDDTIGYLHDLLAQESQLAIILTMDTEDDAALSGLQPLVDPVRVERLQPLSVEESNALIDLYVPEIDDSLLEKIVTASGGYPQLVRWFAEAHAQNTNTIYETLRQTVYKQSDEVFRDLWQLFTRDERLVLTAIASLIYNDPIKPVTAKRIESWLVETDYLLDIVAINAALRGLDYRHVVSYQEGGGIKLTVGLMQKWLLEQARLDETATRVGDSIPWQVAIVIIAVIVLLLLALLLLPPQFVLPESVVPTATLVP
ncbi:MAG: hypothetical protein AAFR81_06935 [Chloroflexota bacterium]